MADKKITALTAMTTPSDDDIFAIVDAPGTSPVTKSIRWDYIKYEMGQQLVNYVVRVLSIYSATGTTASLAQNAVETIITAGTTKAVYMVNAISGTSTNTAWSGTWMVYVDGNVTITVASAGGTLVDCVASGTNIQLKNLNATAQAIKWSYLRVG